LPSRPCGPTKPFRNIAEPRVSTRGHSAGRRAQAIANHSPKSTRAERGARTPIAPKMTGKAGPGLLPC
jgi:hypothetical protein